MYSTSFYHVSNYCHFFHFFINLSVYFNFCIHSLVLLSFWIDSQGLLLSVLSQFCLILSVYTPNERASPNGIWPFRSERPSGFSTPFRCKAPPSGFFDRFAVRGLMSFRHLFAASKTFWVFENVSSNDAILVFTPLRVYLSLTSILYPFEFLRSFAVLDYYVYNWSLRVFYTLLRFWGRLQGLDHHGFLTFTSILYPFELLTSFVAFRPSRVCLNFTSILYPFEFLTSFVAFRTLRL